MSIETVLRIVLNALCHVVTYGEDSLENLTNSIKNLKTLLKTIEEAKKKEAAQNGEDGHDQQG